MTLKTSIICGNVNMIDQAITPSSVDLVVTKAPNFFTSKMSLREYMEEMRTAFKCCYHVLKSGHYIALVVPKMVVDVTPPTTSSPPASSTRVWLS